MIAAIAEIQKEVPDHPKARSLADRAYWLKARELMGKKRYLDAIAAFKQMSADSKGRDAAIRQAKECIRKQDLSEKLETARDYMKKKSYAGAIHMSEEILALDPDNQEARQVYNAGQYALGRQLLEQDENALAIQILSDVDKEFKDTKELMAQARGRLKTQAETLYRNGVKHFINEELEKAIECWQKALAINPMHFKARQDMENARRLLEKWRGLDQ
jgi:tetratricopeptide (TPR) repeat protein